MEWTRGDHTISTDRARLDVPLIHRFLSEESYWAKGRSREKVERSIESSICFGLYDRAGAQIGFTRVVTDRATFAWVCDVFVLPRGRGAGLARWMMETMLEHPELQELRRWLLGTRDAHELYAGFGFTPLADPSRFMERFTGRAG